VIRDDKLSELAETTGAYLTEKLTALAAKHPTYIQNLRGKGTYLAFDCETVEMRNDLISMLKTQGVNQGGCGVNSVRFRPTLYFEKHHADIYVKALD